MSVFYYQDWVGAWFQLILSFNQISVGTIRVESAGDQHSTFFVIEVQLKLKEQKSSSSHTFELVAFGRQLSHLL